MVVLFSFPTLTQLMTPYLVHSVAHKGLGLLTSLNLIKTAFYEHATDKSRVDFIETLLPGSSWLDSLELKLTITEAL